MLEGRQALNLALDFARMPTLVEVMRAQPLPPDTLVVIRIAAGCHETCREAERVTGLHAAMIKEACVLYLQKVLFAPNADSHRVLGVQPDAPRAVMREHLRWLLKWLHPDANQDEWDSVFAERVLKAWRDAGSRKHAPQSDSGHAIAPWRSQRASRRSRRFIQRWVEIPLSPTSPPERAKRRRVMAMTIAAILGLAIAVTSVSTPLPKLLSKLPWAAEQPSDLTANE